jgi:predicted nucleic acid-binding protein
MRIVSDTGPIIGLAKIGMINLLRAVATEVLIPPFVHKELFGRTGAETDHIEDALRDFIKVTPVEGLQSLESGFLSELGEGEKEAVALASELGEGILLLIDDNAGRKAARRLGVAVTGLIGLLLLAKKSGRLGRVGPILDELRQAGYWLSDDVIAIAKQIAED